MDVYDDTFDSGFLIDAAVRQALDLIVRRRRGLGPLARAPVFDYTVRGDPMIDVDVRVWRSRALVDEFRVWGHELEIWLADSRLRRIVREEADAADLDELFVPDDDDLGRLRV